MSVTTMQRGGLTTDVDIHGVTAMEVLDLGDKGMCVNVVTDDGIKVGLFCGRESVEQLRLSMITIAKSGAA